MPRIRTRAPRRRALATRRLSAGHELRRNRRRGRSTLRWLLSGVLVVTGATAFADTEVTIAADRYTLDDHPRVLFDGPAGELFGRLEDPDGAGAGVAAQADNANPAFAALESRIRECVSAAAPCVRDTLASDVLLAALDWTMDHSQTRSLAAAKHWLNSIEHLATDGFGFGCDVTAADCGIGANSERPADDLVYYALAYTLIRSQMSAQERTAFARKMLNDTRDPEGGCRNQLQPLPDAVASYVSGATEISGSGLSGMDAGRTLYIKDPLTTAAGWVEVAKVEGAGSLTLTAAPRSPLGGDAASVTNGTVFVLEPWSPQTCGLVWMLQNHPYNPRAETIGFVETTLAAAITADQTTINVTSVTGLPAEVPYYVSIDGREVVEVTSADSTTLTVGRAKLGTTAAAAASRKRVYYTRTIPNLGTTDFAHSSVISKLSGYAFIANALADDSDAARALLDDAVSDWLIHVHPKNKDMWTGFQQGGSSVYGSERQLTLNAAMTAMLRRLRGSPTLDKSDGDWLRHAVPAHLFTALPGDESRFVPWGDPEVAETSTAYSHRWAPILTGIYGAASEESKHWNHWQRAVAGQYTASGLASDTAARLLPFALLYYQESDPSADYTRAYPLQRAFATVDGSASHALAAWISRTAWTASDAGVVFATAFPTAWSTDHIGSGAPGAYKIYVNGWVLTENGPHDTGVGADTNMPLFGDGANLAASRLISLNRVSSDEAAGAYAYVQINSQAAYHTKASATRVLRSIVHLKKRGTRDYVVVYDSLQSWAGVTKTLNLYFDKTAGESSEMSSSALPHLVWTGPDRRLSTTMVIPNVAAVAATYEATPNAHRIALCASVDGSTCDGDNMEADFLLVHRPSAEVSDAMPAVTAIGTIDPSFVGVEIAGDDPKVALFPKGGVPRPRASFTTTHSGIAQVLVTGLEVGVYDVRRNGAVVCDDVAATPEGEAVYCELERGAITVSQVPPPD